VVSVIGITMGLAVYFFGKPLISIFSPGNEAVIAAGIRKLSITGVTQFICGLMEVGCGVMRGLGKSLTPMFVSLMGSCALRLVWVWTVFAMFPLPEVLYISYPITWIITAAAHYICCFTTLRKRLRQEAA
jgi:Na+-driven multidrug efflux pump